MKINRIYAFKLIAGSADDLGYEATEEDARTGRPWSVLPDQQKDHPPEGEG